MLIFESARKNMVWMLKNRLRQAKDTKKASVFHPYKNVNVLYLF
jgi:hypothetical protein